MLKLWLTWSKAVGVQQPQSMMHMQFLNFYESSFKYLLCYYRLHTLASRFMCNGALDSGLGASYNTGYVHGDQSFLVESSLPLQLYPLTKSESRIFKTETESTLACNHCQILERLKHKTRNVVHLNKKLEKWAAVLLWTGI